MAGVFGTLVGGTALIYTLAHLGLLAFPDHRLPEFSHWLEWAYLNLGSSIPVFAVLLLAYFVTLQRLRTGLNDASEGDGARTNQIVQLDQLCDIWTTLFFGTGVIWTAIGMRGALIYALGDPDATLQQGAFAILERMVNGGILLALSTTIFGGVGGYLMRVYKALTLGSQLQQHYDRAARFDTVAMRDSLARIEHHLDKTGTENETGTDPIPGMGSVPLSTQRSHGPATGEQR
ncbi:MAG: hypothetical protein JSV45_09805 [Chromatiales bacterium]|nr:MAG: hypothetical protein JSV45_09805 [Chromatiales bacterium]